MWPPGPPGWGLGAVLTTLHQKKCIFVTETTTGLTCSGCPATLRQNSSVSMNSMGESRKKAHVGNSGAMDIKTKLRVGFWNVRTMFESPETTQIIQEIKTYKLHILGISESRWTGYGENKTGTGETILYSGRDDNQHSEGVALILKKGMNKHLLEWQPVNERIMTARFNGRYAKLYIIQCYAPTNEAEEEDKEAFYRRLQETVDKVPAHDVLCIMGDLNAKVGNNN